jgi:hypothetical protein
MWTVWTHASDAALMDLLDGSAGDRVLAHVARCPRCRTRVEEARSALAWTAQATVPEPAASYWDIVRRQVAARIVDPPALRSRRPLWAAVALAGAAMAALLTLMPARVPTTPEPATVAALPAWSALPSEEDDPGLPVLEQVAPTLVAGAPAVECSDLAACVADLTDEESGRLADELRRELDQGRTL